MTKAYLDDIKAIINLIKSGDESSPDNLSNWSNHIQIIHQAIDDLKQKHPEEIYVHNLHQLKPRIHHRLSFNQLQYFSVPFERELKNRTINNQRVQLQSDATLKTKQIFPLVIILDNLRSAENVGSIIRTAECFGAEQVVFCGYTPDSTHAQVRKVSMGTEDFIQTQQFQNTTEAISHFKKLNYQVIGVELSDTAKKIEQSFIKKPTAFVFGNERFGLSLETMELCDEVRLIPLFGIKNSLNVSVCAGITLYEWSQQWLNS